MRNQTKIVINADGVKALLAHDTEGTVELAKSAASLVAEQLTKMVVKERVEARIKTITDEMLYKEGKWFGNLMSEKANSMLNESINIKVESKLNMTVGSAQYKELLSQISLIINEEKEKLLADLSGKIDDLIRVRFAAAFGVDK